MELFMLTLFLVPSRRLVVDSDRKILMGGEMDGS